MPEENKMTEEEAEKKAEMSMEMHKRVADQHASAFEAWLNEHKDATKEEAHERLVKTIEAATMFNLMTLLML